ncbi:molecular chaperone HtpG [Prochlorococcus sp. MIT 1223]|uniref:molecular chaperone HtpG n=1 Tax=Prochlorococcus sp. MIT 1223 TaxID=3096217 RepID=UPI002A751503|nr:molecular chaperone HtpG [Prochlorococcus sp. MIT 1223]
MTVLEEGQIQIHTENIFPIIKKAVYSDHEIFLRELVSNGVDAINKRRMVSMAGDCIEGDIGKINIRIDRENKTLTFSDNGIGMSADEIKKYINQVAFSSAEEFLEKYKNDQDTFIGHFGLGFYSSFMVAKNVEIISKSAIEENNSIKWSCDGSPNFTLEEGNRQEIGTDIILHLMDEELEYIEPTRIKTLITKYCDFMPIEVALEGEVINKMNPAWRKNQKELEDKDYIELYKYLYPFQGEPLLWVHLNTDYPYNLQGILFFPKITGRADWENGEIKLYCNQVFVSDSIKEVVPKYLLPLRGVLDSADIPLNVSRSALQSDRRVKSIGNFVAKKVADRLKALYKENNEKYAEIWDSISPFLKIGAMEDEKFADLIENIMLYTTTLTIDEDTSEKKKEIISVKDKCYTTIKNYIDRLEEGSEKRVIYSTDDLSQQNALNLWVAQGVEVLKTDSVIDSQFIPWLENRNNEIKFQRVDSELDNNLQEDLPELVDKDGENDSDKIQLLVKSAIKKENVTIQVKALKGESAPASMILLPEQMRRINDIGALMEQRLPGLPDHHILLINQKHSLVQGLLKLDSAAIVLDSNDESPSRKLSLELANHLYDMAKLSVGGLEPNELAGFYSRNADLMGKLVSSYS